MTGDLVAAVDLVVFWVSFFVLLFLRVPDCCVYDVTKIGDEVADEDGQVDAHDVLALEELLLPSQLSLKVRH